MEASTQSEQVHEVPIGEAMAEAAGIDQVEEKTRPRPGPRAEEEAAKVQAEEDLDILQPKVAAREWRFGPETNPLTYTQRELSVIGKAQWFSLVGEVVDRAFSGESGLSLNSLMAVPQPRQQGQFQIQDFQDADMFVHAIGKLMTHAPEFLEKSVCIWLSVPDYEWTLVRDTMKLSPELGGMSDEMFEEIFATFIDQNYKSINAFFRERFPRLRARWQARQKEASPSR